MGAATQRGPSAAPGRTLSGPLATGQPDNRVLGEGQRERPRVGSGPGAAARTEVSRSSGGTARRRQRLARRPRSPASPSAEHRRCRDPAAGNTAFGAAWVFLRFPASFLAYALGTTHCPVEGAAPSVVARLAGFGGGAKPAPERAGEEGPESRGVRRGAGPVTHPAEGQPRGSRWPRSSDFWPRRARLHGDFSLMEGFPGERFCQGTGRRRRQRCTKRRGAGLRAAVSAPCPSLPALGPWWYLVKHSCTWTAVSLLCNATTRCT